jgi:predicted dehydrogenase
VSGAARDVDGPVRIGVVGLGYWGPNLARNFNALADCELRWCCDSSAAARERWGRGFPSTRFSAELDELLADPDLDAVVVATGVSSHGSLAQRVLAAGKHCFVEKPLAHTAEEAAALAEAAEAAGPILMVGHLLEYHPGVRKLKEVLDSGSLGKLYYVYSKRLNLGQIREHENALWSLGAHDVSVLLHLFDGEEPEELLAHGESFVREGVEDVVFCYMRFPSGRLAHMHLSWLDPHKERRFTVVGSRRMATFDDMALERKVTVYDKGFDPDFRNYGEYITRSGDVMSPQVSNEEPLRIECRHFVECLRDGAEPRTGPASALRTVRVLESLQRSLDAGGSPQRPATPEQVGREDSSVR